MPRLAMAALGLAWAVAAPAAAPAASSATDPELRPAAPKPPMAPEQCRKEFPGPAFLSEAHARGFAPDSNCFEVDLLSNRFHAPPNSACRLSFHASTWLASGWRFAGISGNGRFQLAFPPGGIEVRIDMGGGFRLHSVRLASIEPMKPSDCESVKLRDVLR